MTTGNLVLEDSVIQIAPTAASQNGITASGAGTVSVHRSVISGGWNGVALSGGATADISQTKFVGALHGAVFVQAVTASTTSRANVSESQFFRNHVGVWARGDTVNAQAYANVAHSFFSANDYGVVSDSVAEGAGTHVTLGGSQVSGSTQYGLYNCCYGSTLLSLGNNQVVDNAGNVYGGGTPTTFSPM